MPREEPAIRDHSPPTSAGDGSAPPLLPVSCSDLQTSQSYCRVVTRRAHSSFPLAFRLLARPKRDATTALYAFFRVTDDLADGPGDAGAKRAALGDWRRRLDAALSGKYSHPVHAALHHAVRTFGVSPAHLHEVLDGVEGDLDPVRFAGFDELERYCYRVASAVGLACLPVWGLRAGAGGAARDPAVAAGIAVQLTNILRDLGEDLAAGRVYLPADELARFDAPPEAWAARPPQFRELMRFQVERARRYYDRARPLDPLLEPDGRAVVRLMTALYRRLLDEIERRDYDVFTRRVRVGTLAKARLFLAAWPTRWGMH